MTWIYAVRIGGLERGLASGPFTIVQEPPNLTDSQLANLAGSLLPPRPFLDAARGHPDAVAMVSFLGLPRTRQLDQMADLPPLCTFATGEPALTQEYIRRGVVPAAVCFRPDADWTREPSVEDGPEVAFAIYYLLVTETNVTALDL